MNQQHIFTIQAHKGAITQIKIVSNKIYASSTDGSLSITSINDQNFIQRISTDHPINAFTTSPLIIATDKSLILYNESFQPQQEFQSTAACTSLAIMSPSTVLVGLDDGAARLFDTRSLQELVIFRGHSAPILSISASNQHFFTGCSDGKIVKWDKFGTAISTMFVNFPISSLEISKNNQFLIIGTIAGGIWLVRVEKFEVVKKWNAGGGRFLQRCGQFLHGGKQFLFTGNEENVQIINIASGKIMQFGEKRVEEEVVFAVDCDGEFIVFGGEHARIGVYKLVSE